jgi:phosphonoacetaldehyde hydrolase
MTARGFQSYLKPEELQTKLTHAYTRLSQAGAHFVVDGVVDVPAVIEEIRTRPARGERP